jgi:hypothetical protein
MHARSHLIHILLLTAQVRIMEPLNEANGYSSAGAYTGRIEFALYGKDAPKTVAQFMQFLQPTEMKSTGVAFQDDEVDELGPAPTYANSLFTFCKPGSQLGAGRISGLQKIALAGSSQLQVSCTTISMCYRQANLC